MSIAPPTKRTVIIIASKPNNVTALTMLNRLRGRKKISPRNVPKNCDQDHQRDEQADMKPVDALHYPQ